jgi:hypothetical protein
MLNTIAWCSRTRSANAAALSFTRQPSGLDYVLIKEIRHNRLNRMHFISQLCSTAAWTSASNVSPALLIQITELLLIFSQNHTDTYGISVSTLGLASSYFVTGDQRMRWFEAD